MTIHCPACGGSSETEEIECFAPGWVPLIWTCPECKTRFKMKVEYYTQEEE